MLQSVGFNPICSLPSNTSTAAAAGTATATTELTTDLNNRITELQQRQQQQQNALDQFDAVQILDMGGSGGGRDPPGNDDDGHNSNGDGSSDPAGNDWFNPIAMLVRGIKGRLAADPFFGHKLFVEMGLDAIIITGVNWSARKERFLPEIEFTMCQLAISLLSDFALVYLLAPSTLRSVAKAGSIRAKLGGLPSHVFQQSKMSGPIYRARDRVATLLLKGVQYGGVGFAMGCLGASSVQGLITVREKLDGPAFASPATVQSTLGTGTAWCGFMATSSNVRYNMVNALEDMLYRRSAGAGKMGSFALRLFNNWAGAAQWVMLTRALNLDRPWKPSCPRTSSVGSGKRQRNTKK